MEEHEKEVRAKEDLNSFVWARDGEHKGAVVHQCQILNRIAEFGQVWVKWTSTRKIMCIPRSNIEDPTQGRAQKHSVVVTQVKKTIIQKKQRKCKSTADAKSPVPIQKKKQNNKSTAESPVPLSGTKHGVASKMRVRKKGNINVAQETMMPAVLVGTTAHVNEEFESHDNSIISPPTEIGPVNSAIVEVTVDDVNAKVNSKLLAIEAMDLMEIGDGGDSDEEGFELDFHNDAVRPRVTLCAAKSDGVSEGAVSDDDLDIEYIDNSVGEAWWHMRVPGAKIPGVPDGWSPPGVPENWCGYKPRTSSGAPSEEDIDNPGSWNLYSYTPVYDKKIMSIIKHLPEQLLFQNSLLRGKEKLVIGPSTTMDGGQVILTETPTLGDLLNAKIQNHLTGWDVWMLMFLRSLD